MSEIPEYLKEASRLFLTEVQGHIAYFKARMNEDGSINSTLFQESLVLWREKFHLMKGGAGFLNLTRIRNAAVTGEELCKSIIGGEKDVNSSLPEITKAVSEIREGCAELESILG